jgi:diguanylate cyclase (GGDEF)-like protein
MAKKIDRVFEQYKQTLAIIDECTDDYFYIYDFVNNYFVISASAVDAFALDTYEFDHAIESLRHIVYPQDLEKLDAAMKDITDGKTSTHNLEYRWISKEGLPIWISSRGKVIYEDGLPICLMGRIAEIGKQNKYDNITSLYCENVLEHDYRLLQMNGKNTGFILLIGVDNFKSINEKYGARVGNDVLADIAESIMQCVDDRKYVFRLRGDEFAIMSLTSDDEICDEAKTLYKKIRSRLDDDIERAGYHIFYTISGGASEFDTETDSFDVVMKNIRFALHNAKINGRNTFVAYSEDKYQNHIKRLDIQEHLRDCIENNFESFEVFYQPIMKISQNRVCGAEALIRWHSTKYGYMSPSEFVPLLEESSLIIPLGKWVIENAVRQCKVWMESIPDFVMNINLSFVQIIKSDILKDALEYIDRYGISHDHIVFEVTESGEIENNMSVRNVLNSFNDSSIQLAIDDFGTGYSNLRYIRDMMFGIIKIDREFIKNINRSEDNYTLVKYITEMAHNLNIKVCVEGVETQEELEKVMTLNPDCIQGFYYGKPVKSTEFKDNFVNKPITVH